MAEIVSSTDYRGACHGDSLGDVIKGLLNAGSTWSFGRLVLFFCLFSAFDGCWCQMVFFKLKLNDVSDDFFPIFISTSF